MRKTIIPAIFILAIILVGNYIYLYAKSGNCEICGRTVDERRGAIIKINTFQWQKACCAVCALRYIRDEKKEVLSILVRDLKSSKYIDAGKAYYVTGSSERSCCSGGLQRDQTGVYFLCYDRCIPNSVAFEKIEDAEQFKSTMGGRLITYAELMEMISFQDTARKDMISAPIAQ